MTSAARIKALAEETAKAFAIRPARPEDCGDIAMLFLLSSDGLAEYIWSQAGPEGASPLETGRRRYAREGVAFSYQNCLVAEEDGLAMLHSFVMPPREETGDEAAANDNDNGEAVDPVLQPYAELEDPGSLYVSGVAVTPEHRGRGLGGKLMAQARARAEALDLPRVSLICFEANETAMQLYRRLGYAEVDRRPVVPHPSLHYSAGAAVLLVRGLD
jgi:ribosomal protein S18 acetylase RimI-like enzyme